MSADELRGVVEDLAGVAIVGRHVEGASLRGAEGLLAGGERLEWVRPRALRRVTDDGPGRAATAAAEHPPLHGGEVLRLVHEDMGVARRPADAAQHKAIAGVGGGLLGPGR